MSNVQCAMCNEQCAMNNEQCAMNNLQLSYFQMIVRLFTRLLVYSSNRFPIKKSQNYFFLASHLIILSYNCSAETGLDK